MATGGTGGTNHPLSPEKKTLSVTKSSFAYVTSLRNAPPNSFLAARRCQDRIPSRVGIGKEINHKALLSAKTAGSEKSEIVFEGKA